MAYDVRKIIKMITKITLQTVNVTLVFTICHQKNREKYTCLRFSLWLQVNQGKKQTEYHAKHFLRNSHSTKPEQFFVQD